MRKRIFKNTALLVVVSILLTFFVMELVMYNRMYAQMKLRVEDACGYLQAAINDVGEDYLTREIAGISHCRITLIDQDGDVLYESEEPADQLENHNERPEVAMAREKGKGYDSRLSQTLSRQTYYYALQLKDGKVIRVSDTIDSVWQNLLSGLGIAVVLMVALVILALLCVRIMTNRIVAPINRLNLEHPLDNEGDTYEEISPLLGRIHRQNLQIDRQLQEMKQNQEEYLAITEYMKDGLIVTNRHVVLSINRAAQKLFGVSQEECVNHDIVTVSRNEVLKQALLEALEGNSNEKLLKINERAYQILANPVQVNQQVSGAVILVLDVTEKQAAEAMRREFSANVSHELKTPLMSISGYAEIIENGMVKPQDIPNFAGRIHSEAKRLSNLVEDIIRLSRLDEAGEESLPREKVDLSELCTDVQTHLAMTAKERKVSFSYQGQHLEVTGIRQVLYEMIYNLCDNAVKYNKEGGKVELELGTWEGQPRLVVRDNGIGIAKEEIDRIFERFYRVDKSHSRETGGTGLGLSIVKHGAILHKAKIDVKSQPGQGTQVTVTLPRQD